MSHVQMSFQILLNLFPKLAFGLNQFKPVRELSAFFHHKLLFQSSLIGGGILRDPTSFSHNPPNPGSILFFCSIKSTNYFG